MADVYVIRHAWAENRELLRWPTDHQRPLTGDGRRRFAAVVKRLAERGFAPELIATSPLVRCWQTAEIVAETVGNGAPIVALEALAPGSDLQALLAWTAREAGEYDQVAWVGHAPDVGWLASRLIGAAGGGLRFAKGAVAAVRFADRPAAGQGQLRWLVTAQMAGC